MKNEHPCKMLKHYLKLKNISITQAAKDLGVTRQTVSNFVNHNYNRGLSIDFATRLENIYGFDRIKLLNMQLMHDIEKYDNEKI